MTVKSFIKLKSVKIHVSFCKIKEKIKFMEKTNKISIILGVIAHLVLWIFFLQSQIKPHMDYFDEHYDKTYYTLPVAIILALTISHFYHKKDKPNQKFWDTNRKESIKEIIVYIKQAKVNLFQLETVNPNKSPRTLQFLFNNDISGIRDIATTHGQYLSNNEHKLIRNFIMFVSQYVELLTTPPGDERSKSIIVCISNIEAQIANLIIKFELTSIDEIKILLKPISKSVEDSSLISKRGHRQFMIEKALNIKIGIS